ncbi:MAG: hypothetical protein LBR77_03185 [Lachnospiraceae bacterium]|jgi:hypothetical protein|nr:hypothetical protein [Lachnospiraceae bacterium]
MEQADGQNTFPILHSDFAALKAEVEKLRVEFSMLVMERDQIRYHECPDIQMRYTLTFGALEYKVFELETQIMRIKRSMEMIQARKNRQEPVDVKDIERILEEELAAYKARLEEYARQMNDALDRSKLGHLSDKDAAELKKLYRTVVKALHPDSHPDQSEERKRLFQNAVDAYEKGNLPEMRIIAAMVDQADFQELGPDQMELLRKEKDRLIQVMDAVRAGIELIKSAFPYTMKALLESPDKISVKKAALEDRIAQLLELHATYKERYDELLWSL